MNRLDRRHPTASDALADAGEGESVVYLSGVFQVVTSGEADDLTAAGVAFARLRVPSNGGCPSGIALIPIGDDG